MGGILFVKWSNSERGAVREAVLIPNEDLKTEFFKSIREFGAAPSIMWGFTTLCDAWDLQMHEEVRGVLTS